MSLKLYVNINYANDTEVNDVSVPLKSMDDLSKAIKAVLYTFESKDTTWSSVSAVVVNTGD